MFSKTLAGAGLLASFAISAINAIDPISVVGSKFFYSNGTQYFIKGTVRHPPLAPSRHGGAHCANVRPGIAYQLTEADPLLNTEQCQRDASLMKTLNANAIRVYHVDPDGDHSGCMSAFADAGIYLLVDLDTFNTAIDPVSSPPPCSQRYNT
jgi:hypothetical protein